MKQRHPAAHLLNAIAEGETEFLVKQPHGDGEEATYLECSTNQVLYGLSIGKNGCFMLKPDDWAKAKFGDRVWSDDFFGGYCTFVAYRDGTVYVTGDSTEGKGFEAQVATNPRLIKE